MRHLVFALALALAAAPAMAQPLHDGPPDAEQRIAHLTDQLDLDSAQATRVAAVLEAAHEAGRALHTAHREALAELTAARDSRDEAAIRSALDALDASREAAEAERRATLDAVNAELSLVQQAEFALAQHARRERRGEALERVGDRLRAEGGRQRGERESGELSGLSGL
ncbi:MAG: Spy/CpxP family protein refolding chaperone [Myxococcota bacterium]|jgi:Spy/CpxP family protein refolding chaperone